jgi:protoglobin
MQRSIVILALASVAVRIETVAGRIREARKGEWGWIDGDARSLVLEGSARPASRRCSMVPFELTQDDLDRRKSSLDFTPDDEQRLLDADRHLRVEVGAIIDLLNVYLVVRLRALHAGASSTVTEQITTLHARHFTEITGGDWRLPYFARRLAAGHVFYAIDSSLDCYLGAYQQYLQLATDSLARLHRTDAASFLDATASLTKAARLDMGLLLDAVEPARASDADHASPSPNDTIRCLLAMTHRASELIALDMKDPLAQVDAFLRTLESQAHPYGIVDRTALHDAVIHCRRLVEQVITLCGASIPGSASTPAMPGVYGPAIGAVLATPYLS